MFIKLNYLGLGGPGGSSGAGSASYRPQNERDGGQEGDQDKRTDNSHEGRHSGKKTSHSAKENTLESCPGNTSDASLVVVSDIEKEDMIVKNGCKFDSTVCSNNNSIKYPNLFEGQNAIVVHNVHCDDTTPKKRNEVLKEFTSSLNHLSESPYRVSKAVASTVMINKDESPPHVIHFRSRNIVDLIEKFNVSISLGSTDDRNRMKSAIEAKKIVNKPKTFGEEKHYLHDTYSCKS